MPAAALRPVPGILTIDGDFTDRRRVLGSDRRTDRGDRFDQSRFRAPPRWGTVDIQLVNGFIPGGRSFRDLSYVGHGNLATMTERLF